MATIYQWKLEQDFGRDTFKVRKKVVEAKETAKQYRALEEEFVNFQRTLLKASIDTVSMGSFREPVYSSLDPNEEVALAKLKEWYKDYSNRKIADLTSEIERRKNLLQQVESLTIEG